VSLFLSLCFSLSLCPSVLSLCTSFSLALFFSFYLFLCPSVSLSLSLIVSLCFVSLSLSFSPCLSFSLSLCPSVSLERERERERGRSSHVVIFGLLMVPRVSKFRNRKTQQMNAWLKSWCRRGRILDSWITGTVSGEGGTCTNGTVCT